MQPDYALCIEIYERPDLGAGVVQIDESFNIQKAKCCWSGALSSGHGGVLAGLGE